MSVAEDPDRVLHLLRDAVASLLIAGPAALVVWLLPFAGVPVLALLTAPVGFLLLGAWGLTPVLLVDGTRPLRQTLLGGALLLLGGLLTSATTTWTLGVAHAAALGWSRGGGPSALAGLALPLAALLVPFGLLLAGLLLARGIRVAAAVLVAAGLVSIAPATANTLLLYAWLGLPLSA